MSTFFWKNHNTLTASGEGEGGGGHPKVAAAPVLPGFFLPRLRGKKRPGRGKKRPDPEMYQNIEGYVCIVVF